MFTKTITYTDYDGNERTENFLFNMSKAEILEMEMSKDGGMKQLLEKIVQAQDIPKITYYFKQIILKGYGEKSPDGKRFIKNEELSTAFSQTEAYSNLYIELATNTEAGIEFVNALFPEKLINEIREAYEKNQEKNNAKIANLTPVVPQ